MSGAVRPCPAIRALSAPQRPARKIIDQLGHSRISMTQDRYLGRKLTDRQTAEVLEKLLGWREPGAKK
ncbi:MAG: hypothetical protein LC721_03785 [Actinobacteria bacterium]|nr:hypothetical protein [Actinomycetota bacterium]